MNAHDALIAARALNIDGGEGSGVKGHVTDRKYVAKGNTYAAKGVLMNAGFAYNAETKTWHGEEEHKQEFDRITRPSYSRANGNAARGLSFVERVAETKATLQNTPKYGTNGHLALYGSPADQNAQLAQHDANFGSKVWKAP